MDELLVYLQNEPIVLVLLAVVAATLAAFLILPGLLRPIQVMKVKEEKKPQPKAAAKEKVASEATTVKQVTTIGLLKNWKAVLVIAAFLIAASGGLLYLYVQNTSILILSARQLLLLERSEMELLKSGVSYVEIYEKGNILLLDSRDYTDFYKVHAKGASNVTLEGILEADQLYYPKDKKVVIYGTVDQLDQIRKVAEKLREAGVKKIYIIKDGIEGFQDAGYPVNENQPISSNQLELLAMLVNTTPA